MLHTKFCGNRPSGSREDFFFPDFYFLVPESFPAKFGSDRHSSFLENPV